MDVKMIVANWIKESREAAELTGEQLGMRLEHELKTKRGHSKGNISHWENGKHEPNLAQLLAISKITGKPLPQEISAKGLIVNQERVPYGAADHPRRRIADFDLVHEEDSDGDVGLIQYWAAKGSCGGGFLNYDQLPKGHLVKEASFFSRYSLKPSNAIAIYADGDSMRDFIVDGDIVIFDKSKTRPISGKIFLIEHPEGLRIKELRLNIDGSWILESRNPDKRQFPDERIPPDQKDLLKIVGEFIYRQGGY